MSDISLVIQQFSLAVYFPLAFRFSCYRPLSLPPLLRILSNMSTVRPTWVLGYYRRALIASIVLLFQCSPWSLSDMMIVEGKIPISGSAIRASEWMARIFRLIRGLKQIENRGSEREFILVRRD